MRLLHVERLEFHEFLHDNQRPKYAIASHRWCDSEARFRDVIDRRNTTTAGYKKVEAFAAYVRQHLPEIEWLWIDTCCINKDSAAELSEAINLMFEWYRDAEVCLAYLPDVVERDDVAAFRMSEWFERAWTLQELVAPRTVVFLTKSWQVLGHRGNASGGCLSVMTIGPNLDEQIAEITKVPLAVLRDYGASGDLTTGEKLAWMEGRESTKEEDKSYALYGILGVSLGANYGERDKARERLLAALRQRENLATEQAEFYLKASAWISPTNPWENHRIARQLRQPETGNWLLQSEEYRDWKSGLTRHLWLYGPAGCGKTIICSSIIDDVIKYCQIAPRAGQAFFYFTFSDATKQNFENMVRSVVAQLAQKEPGLSLLRKAYENRNTAIGIDELCRMLKASIASYDEVFLHIDALDECSIQQNAGKSTLSSMISLLTDVPKLRMVATSRDNPETRRCMEVVHAKLLSLDMTAVNADIRAYVSSQLMVDPKLSRLSHQTKRLIEDTLSEKADGMFRWADCQLQELRRSKSTKPKAIQAALLALPATLDDTYARTFLDMTESERTDALILLRWIAYAQTPRTLAELAEATIIDPTDDPHLDGVVDIENRGSWTDVLALLAGLVIVDDDSRRRDHTGYQPPIPTHEDSGRVTEKTTIRLAHFSVLEYLESSRILMSEARMFHLVPEREHRFLTDSCLVYLEFYRTSHCGTQRLEDTVAFPLLIYAATHWHYHSDLKQSDTGNTRELSLLMSDDKKREWLHWENYVLEDGVPRFALGLSSLYCASRFGLKRIVKDLIDRGVELCSSEGFYGNALEVAIAFGHSDNRRGTYEIAEMLIAYGADVNAIGGDDGSPLHAAVLNGNIDIVKILIENGADVNAVGEEDGPPLHNAALTDNNDVAKVLIENGADVNVKSNGGNGAYWTALRIAAGRGNVELVKLLLANGADVTVGGSVEQAMQTALERGIDHVFLALFDSLDGVHASGVDNLGRTALHLKAAHGHFIDNDIGSYSVIDINAADKQQWTALHWAAYWGMRHNAEIIVRFGADKTKTDWQGWTPHDVAVFMNDADTAAVLKTASAAICRAVGDKFHAICDSCRHRLIGKQHHCLGCEDFDLCFRCFRDVNIIHPNHEFTTAGRSFIDPVDADASGLVEPIPRGATAQSTSWGDYVAVVVEPPPR